MPQQLPVNFEPITISLNGQKQTLDPQAYLRVDRSNLSEELANHAEYYAYWGYIGAQVNFNLEALKLECDILKADIDMQIRKAAANNAKKVTEAQIGALIDKEPAYIELYKTYLESKRISEYVRSVVIAMYSKFKTLEELAKNERGENAIVAHPGVMSPINNTQK